MKTLIIQDPGMRKGFTAIPSAVLHALGLSMAAKAMYAILLSFAWQNEECWPGQGALATAADCHRNSVQKYLNELRDYGLISWKVQGLNRPNIYYIHKLEDVEALKLKDAQGRVHPDAQGCVQQDAHVLVQEEDSINNHVVVVDNPDPDTASREGRANPADVEAAISVIEDGTSVRIEPGLVAKMINEYGPDYVLEKARLTAHSGDSNIPGFFREACSQDWKPQPRRRPKTSVRTSNKKKRGAQSGFSISPLTQYELEKRQREIALIESLGN
ncbi:MAG: helix-turn-helix domain-containing protein [Desulforudis sp.]|nr:MAG: helix-turn-helix domain-containing protein [Desulforudis sp.]